MKKSILQVTTAILVIILALAMMPGFVNAAEKKEGIILEKKDDVKIVYIKGMDSTEYKYAFSDNEDSSTVTFITASKDSNGEYVATIEAGSTYKYMFILQEDKMETIELNQFNMIKEEEINTIDNFTKLIGITTDKSDTNISNENDVTSTTVKGKITITDEGTYRYQIFEILDKNNSTKILNSKAVELYNKLTELNDLGKMYDGLSKKAAIYKEFSDLVENDDWKDAVNNEISEPEDAQKGEKFLVLIQEVKDGAVVRSDIQIMMSDREDDSGVEKTEKEETKKVEKRTKLPVTGENIAMYIGFGVIIVAIIVVIARMKNLKGKENEEK